MKGAQSISTRRAYGVQRICRVWGRARSSRATARDEGARITAPRAGRCRPGRGAGRPQFSWRGVRKAWAKLRVAGIRTSKERVRRLMRETSRRRTAWATRTARRHTTARSPRRRPMRCGDAMTATVTIGEGSAFVFVAVDHCTTECIGLHAAKSGSRFEALEPIRQGVTKAWPMGCADDHGSTYLADDFQQDVAAASKAPRASCLEGNGVADASAR